MENLKRRGLSLLLALVMIVSLFAGIQLPQASAAGTVEYVYSGNYVYNWGTRGTTATYLSPKAEAWYSTQGTSYDALSALPGSSTESSVPSSALYKELQSLMGGAQTYTTSYDATKTLFQYTDCENSGSPKTISSFYSGNAIGPSWDGSWNREHTWPNSKGDAAGSGENDIMMLRPTSMSENSSRGNTAYGQSSGYYNPNSESSTYDLRGDVARIILFVYVRWNCTNTGSDYNPNGIFGKDGVFESKAVLLDWMEEDPVDTWELGRNDSVESITGTRNVFVDYPELAFLLFNETVPTDYTTPSGEAAVSAFTLTATSNNTSYGTVSVSGRNINASPAEGYYAAGYTVTSGNATVTQDGNTFTVSASDDCTVQINFAAKTAATVTFMENGTTSSTMATYLGDSITLPSPTATPDNYTFVGWVTDEVQDAESKPTTVYAAGSSYTVTATTLYALYSYVQNDGSGTGMWTLVTDASTLSAGAQLVIAYNGKSVVAGTYTSTKYFATSSATFASDLNTITELSDDAVVFTLGGSEGAWTLANSEGTLLGSSSQSLKWGSGTTTWTISASTDGTATIASTSDSEGYLQYNISAPRFKTYSGQTNPQLYMMDGTAGTTYYTTSTCDHTGTTTTVAQQDATCTEVGYTAGVQCNDCGGFIRGHEVIPATNHPNTTTTTVDPTCTAAGSTTVTCDDCGTTVSTTSIEATGHSYTSVVTPPTATEKGYTTHTCSACGDSYVDSYTDALGETFTVSFSVPGGVTAIADMACNNTGITLPTPEGTPTGEYTYTFLGWVEATVNNTEIKPENIHKAGETFTATTNTTLYALYSYVIAGDGSSTDYVLTDLESISAADSVVITMTSADGATIYALSSANGASSAPGKATVTSDGTKLTSGEPADDLKWNIVSTTDGYIIYVAGSTEKWLYCTDANNGVRVGTNTNNVFTITSGYFFNNATSRYVGVYTTNPDWRCYTSINSNIEGQTLGFYVKSSGTSYYTTIFCEHANTTEVAGKDATCTEDGYEAGTKCTSCGAFVSGGAVIPATGHVNTTTTTVDATCNQAGSITVTCACGEVVSTEEIPATGNHSYVDGVCSICGTAESSDGINYGPLKENTAYTMYVVQKTLAKNLYFTGEAVASNEEGSFLGTSDTWSDSVDVYVEYTDTGVLFYFYTKDTNTKTYIQIFINSENSPRAQFVTDSADIVPFVYNEEKELYLVTLTDGNGYTNDHYWGSYQGYSYIRASSTYYLSDANPTKDQQYVVEFCTHDVKNTVTVEPTCTEDGSEKVVCEHCLAILKETVLPALGHNFVDGVCTRCGLAQLTLTFVTPAGVTAVPAISFIEGESVTLPTATGTPTVENDIVYEFVGWSTKHIDNVENYMDVVEEGTYFDKETTQTFTDNVTLYAVYTYTIEGESSGTDTGTTTETSTYTVNISDYATANSWSNSQQYPTINIADGITVNATTSGNNAKYYSSDSTWRLYQFDSGSITFTSDKTIVSIKITYTKGNNGYLKYNETTVSSGDTVEINAPSATFSVATTTSGKSNGQAKITSIEVVIAGSESSGGASTTNVVYHTTIFTTEECQHTNTTVETVDSTCTTAGTKTTTCTDCNTEISVESLPLADHSNSYTINNDGTHTYSCSVCNSNAVTEKHAFNETTGVCVCGLADTLRFHAASLTIEEGISVNFKAKTYLFDEGGLGYSTPYAVFQIYGHNFKVTDYKVENGYYVFTLYNVRPDWMGENIAATLCATEDGAEVSSKTMDYSIYTYCNNKLNEIVTAAEADRDLALAKLLVDVLNYGAATQTYTGHNTDSLVNANLGYAAGWGSTGTPNVTSVYGQTLGTGVTESATWNGAALFLRETTRVRLRFATDDITGVTVNATVGGVPTSISTFRDAGNGNYYVFFDDLLATQMGETITFTIAKDGVVISKDLTYSAESYVVSAVSAYGADSALCQMLYAMIHYGNAAEAYATASAN